ITSSFSSFPPFWRADGSHSHGACTFRGPVLVSGCHASRSLRVGRFGSNRMLVYAGFGLTAHAAHPQPVTLVLAAPAPLISHPPRAHHPRPPSAETLPPYVGCHAICSMRARIWRKSGPVKSNETRIRFPDGTGPPSRVFMNES